MKKRSLFLSPPTLRSLLFTLLGGVPSAPGWVGFFVGWDPFGVTSRLLQWRHGGKRRGPLSRLFSFPPSVSCSHPPPSPFVFSSSLKK